MKEGRKYIHFWFSRVSSLGGLCVKVKITDHITPAGCRITILEELEQVNDYLMYSFWVQTDSITRLPSYMVSYYTVIPIKNVEVRIFGGWYKKVILSHRKKVAWQLFSLSDETVSLVTCFRFN